MINTGKNNSRIRSMAVIAAFFIPVYLWGQIDLITDRTIYATGEEILFSTRLRQSPDIEIPWSKVIYLSLVSPDGTPVTRGKFPVSAFSAHGYLPVPDHLLTGNYYLVAYTRWMQNFSPSNYEFRHIKIINPHSTELEPSCLQGENNLPFRQKSRENTVDEIIACYTDRTYYKTGEKAEVTFQLPEEVAASAAPFTVIAGSPKTIDSMLFTSVLPDTIHYQPTVKIRYLPDLMGMSLSGKVIIKDSGGPAVNSRVELSILGNDPCIRAAVTNEDGFFIMALDSMEGSKEMFIAARSNESENLEIRVDNDFAVRNFIFSPRPFELNDTEQKEATRIMLIAQIRKRTRDRKTGYSVPEEQGKVKFYGYPGSITLIDDYIQLPTLDEVFTELIRGVLPITRNNQRSLVFSSNIVKQQIIGEYDPLILLDGIPVYDQEKLLALSPQRIKRIGVLDDLFHLGDITYGGIIDITSRVGDMAGMDLPAGSFFFDFETLLPQPWMEDLTSSGRQGKEIADVFTNTILWEPELILNHEKVSNLSLTVPDRPGRYLILVRGLSAEGKLIQGRTSFWVE